MWLSRNLSILLINLLAANSLHKKKSLTPNALEQVEVESSQLSKGEIDGSLFEIFSTQVDKINVSEIKIPRTKTKVIFSKSETDSTTSACFIGRDKTILLFVSSELGLPPHDLTDVWLVSNVAPSPIKEKCEHSSEVSKSLKTKGGFYLGMTGSEVEKILGSPELKIDNGVIYEKNFDFFNKDSNNQEFKIRRTSRAEFGFNKDKLNWLHFFKVESSDVE